jgi:uncharacterized repeat protein (TIGR03803 family)
MKMQCSGGLVVLAVVLMLATSAIVPAQAQTFTVLFTFDIQDGLNPNAGLVRDNAGNLYGTTYLGGTFTNGVVFKLDRSDSETVLLNFNGGSNGGFPSSGLILDKAGNLYGPADQGSAGGGVLFKLSPKGKETVLFNFGGCATCLRPRGPEGALLMDTSGNLYGTTLAGGVKGHGIQCNYGCGTIFKLDTARKLHVLYAFKGGADGMWPFGPLLQDAAGDFYGTALYGGDLSCPQGTTRGCGTVFKLAKNGKLTVLYTFTGGPDGAFPAEGGLIRDEAGNFYGSAQGGGNRNCYLGCGTLYKLGKDGKFTVLYTFTDAEDGGTPFGGMALDSKGNLYGTTLGGNTNSYYGTVFKLNKAGVMTVLHVLNGGADGGYPVSGVIRDPAGNLYGTAFVSAGFNGPGTVFKVTP